MTVKITIEYETVEQAILALGKMSGLGKARRAASAPVTAATTVGAQGAASPAPEVGNEPAVPAAPTARPRKPRADKGQARGAYAPRQQEAQASAPQGAASISSGADNPAVDAQASTGSALPGTSTAAVAGAPAASTPAPAGAAPVPSAAEAQAALEAVFEKKGLDVARRVMSEFGVSRLRDLPEAKRAEFITLAKKEVA